MGAATTSGLTEFNLLWKDIDPFLQERVAEAKDLRASVSDPTSEDTVADIHDRAVAARVAQNRIETILSDIGQMRSRLRKLVADLEQDYEDKWRNTMLSTRVGEYQSGKAQDATYQAGAIQELVNVRRAKGYLADVDEAYEVVKLKYYGLNNVRRDNELSVSILNIDSRI